MYFCIHTTAGGKIIVSDGHGLLKREKQKKRKRGGEKGTDVLVAATAAALGDVGAAEGESLTHQPGINRRLGRNITRRVEAHSVEVGCAAALG